MDFRPEDLFDLEEAALQQKSKELYLDMVEPVGIEPTTSSVLGMRSPSLAMAPLWDG